MSTISHTEPYNTNELIENYIFLGMQNSTHFFINISNNVNYNVNIPSQIYNVLINNIIFQIL